MPEKLVINEHLIKRTLLIDTERHINRRNGNTLCD